MSQIDENTLALFDDTTGFITVDQDQRYYLDETTGTEITEFSVDFNDDLPGTIIMRKWSQKVNGLDITIANKNITFIEGSPGFGNDLDSTLLDNPVGFNNYDIRNCNWIATNGLVNGFGQAGRVGGVGVSITCTGILTECNYVGIGAGTLWFVNLEDMPQVEFSNNTLTQAVLNSTRYGTPIYGIEFDGTLRSQQGQYTFRRNAIGLADVWNSHIGSISSGTAYRTTDGNADAQEAFLQYHGTTDKTEYSINTRVESNNYSFQRSRTGNATVFNGYLWNPRWVITNTTTDINDIRITNLTAPIVGTGGILLPQATVDKTTEWVGAADDAALTDAGYFIHTGSRTTTDAQRVLVIDKAVDLDGTLNTTYVYTPRAKSFEFAVDGLVTTVLNEPDIITQETGTIWTYPDTAAGRDLRTAVADQFVGTYTAVTVPTEASDVDDLYPVGKGNWYTGGLNIDLPMSGNASTITFDVDTTIGAATTDITATNIDIAVNGNDLLSGTLVDTITATSGNLTINNINLNDITLDSTTINGSIGSTNNTTTVNVTSDIDITGRSTLGNIVTTSDITAAGITNSIFTAGGTLTLSDSVIGDSLNPAAFATLTAPTIDFAGNNITGISGGEVRISSSTEIQNLGDTTFATITDSGTTLDVSNSDGNTITDTTINANRLLDFNDVVNSIITLTGNATGAPDSSLILDDALETMRLTTTGTISGLTNTQGFFDAATGATKNVEISGTDIDSSIDANAVLINFDNITNSANDFGRIRVVGTGIFNAAATHTTLQFGNDTSNPPPPNATIKNLRVSDSSLTFAEKIGEWIDLYNNDADTQGTASLSGTSNILITLPVGASNILTDGGGIFGYTGTLEFTAIDPLTTVSALVNTTVTSTGRIGSNMPFGDITHSTLNATTSITLGGNLIRNNALAALTTSLTSPIINIDSNDINATDGRIGIVATTSINDASNMLATDVSGSINTTITFPNTSTTDTINDTIIGGTAAADRINTVTLNGVDVLNDSAIFTNNGITGSGDVTNSILDTTNNNITFNANAVIDNSTITAPTMDLTDTTVSNNSNINTINDGDITNVNIVSTGSTLSADGDGDISLTNISNIDSATLSANDIDLSNQPVTNSTVTARNDIDNAANITSSNVDVTNDITFTNADTTVNSSTINSDTFTFNDTNIDNTSVTATNTITGVGDVTDNSAISSDSTITFGAGSVTDSSVSGTSVDLNNSDVSVTATGTSSNITSTTGDITNVENVTASILNSANDITGVQDTSNATVNNLNTQPQLIAVSDISFDALATATNTILRADTLTLNSAHLTTNTTATANGNITQGGNVTDSTVTSTTGNITFSNDQIITGSSTLIKTNNNGTIDLSNATVSDGATIEATNIVGDVITGAHIFTGGNIESSGAVVFTVDADRKIEGGTFNVLSVNLNDTPVSANATINATTDITNSQNITNSTTSSVNLFSGATPGTISGSDITASADVGTTGTRILSIEGTSTVIAGSDVFVDDITDSNITATTGDVDVTNDISNSTINSGNDVNATDVSSSTLIVGNDITVSDILDNSIVTATGNVVSVNISNNSRVVATGNITNSTDVTNSRLVGNGVNSTIQIDGNVTRNDPALAMNITSPNITFTDATQTVTGANVVVATNLSATTTISNIPNLNFVNISPTDITDVLDIDFLAAANVQNSTITANTVDLNQTTISDGTTITATATIGDSITDANIITGATLNATASNIVFSGDVNRRLENSIVNAATINLNETPVTNNSILNITGDITDSKDITNSNISVVNLDSNTGTITNTTIAASGNIGSLAERVLLVTSNTDVAGTTSSALTASNIFVVDNTNSILTTTSGDINISGNVSRDNAALSTNIVSAQAITFNGGAVSGLNSIVSTNLTADTTITDIGNTTFVNITPVTADTLDVTFNALSVVDATNIGSAANRAETIDFKDSEIKGGSSAYASNTINNIGNISGNSEIDATGAITNLGNVTDDSTVTSATSISFTDINEISGNSLVTAPSVDLADTKVDNGRVTSTVGDISTAEDIINDSTLNSARDITDIKTISGSTLIATNDVVWETELADGDNAAAGMIVTAGNDINFNLADISGGTYTATNNILGLDNITADGVTLLRADGTITFDNTSTGSVTGNQLADVPVQLLAIEVGGSVTGNTTNASFVDITSPTVSGFNVVDLNSIIRASITSTINELKSSEISSESKTSGTVNINGDISAGTAGLNLRRPSVIREANIVNISGNIIDSVIEDVTTLNLTGDIVSSAVTPTITDVDTVNITGDILGTLSFNANMSDIITLDMKTDGASISHTTFATKYLTEDTELKGTGNININNAEIVVDTIRDVSLITSSTFEADTVIIEASNTTTGIPLFNGTTRLGVADYLFTGDISGSSYDFTRTSTAGTATPGEVAFELGDKITIQGNASSSTLVSETINITGDATDVNVIGYTDADKKVNTFTSDNIISSDITANVISGVDEISASSSITAPTSSSFNLITDSTIESGAATINIAGKDVLGTITSISNSRILNNEPNTTVLNITNGVITGTATNITVNTINTDAGNIVNVDDIFTLKSPTIGTSLDTGFNFVRAASIETTNAYIRALSDSSIEKTTGELGNSTLIMGGNIEGGADVNMDIVSGAITIQGNSTVIAPVSLAAESVVNSNINFDSTTSTRTRTGSVDLTGSVSGNSVVDGSAITVGGNVTGNADIDSTSSINITGNVSDDSDLFAENITIDGTTSDSVIIQAYDDITLNNVTGETSVTQLGNERTYRFIGPAGGISAGNLGTYNINGLNITLTALNSSTNRLIAQAWADEYNSISDRRSDATLGTVLTADENLVTIFDVPTTVTDNSATNYANGTLAVYVSDTDTTNTIHINGRINGDSNRVSVTGNILDLLGTKDVSDTITNAIINVQNTEGKNSLLNLKETDTSYHVGSEASPFKNAIPVEFDLTAGLTLSQGANNLYDLTFLADSLLPNDDISGTVTNAIGSILNIPRGDFVFVTPTRVEYVGPLQFQIGDMITVIGQSRNETITGLDGTVSVINGRYITPSVTIETFNVDVPGGLSSGGAIINNLTTLGDIELIAGFETTFTVDGTPLTATLEVAANGIDYILTVFDDVAAGASIVVDVTLPKRAVNLYFNDTDWSGIFLENGRLLTPTIIGASELLIIAGGTTTLPFSLPNNITDEISALIERTDLTGNTTYFRIAPEAITAPDRTIVNLDTTRLPAGFAFQENDIIRWTDQVVNVWTRGASTAAPVNDINGYHPNVKLQNTAAFVLAGHNTGEFLSSAFIPPAQNVNGYKIFSRVEFLNENYRSTRALGTNGEAYNQPGVEYAFENPTTILSQNTVFGPATLNNGNAPDAVLDFTGTENARVTITTSDDWEITAGGRTLTSEIKPTLREGSPIQIVTDATTDEPARVFEVLSTTDDIITATVANRIQILANFRFAKVRDYLWTAGTTTDVITVTLDNQAVGADQTVDITDNFTAAQVATQLLTLDGIIRADVDGDVIKVNFSAGLPDEGGNDVGDADLILSGGPALDPATLVEQVNLDTDKEYINLDGQYVAVTTRPQFDYSSFANDNGTGTIGITSSKTVYRHPDPTREIYLWNRSDVNTDTGGWQISGLSLTSEPTLFNSWVFFEPTPPGQRQEVEPSVTGSWYITKADRATIFQAPDGINGLVNTGVIDQVTTDADVGVATGEVTAGGIPEESITRVDERFLLVNEGHSDETLTTDFEATRTFNAQVIGQSVFNISSTNATNIPFPDVDFSTATAQISSITNLGTELRTFNGTIVRDNARGITLVPATEKTVVVTEDPITIPVALVANEAANYITTATLSDLSIFTYTIDGDATIYDNTTSTITRVDDNTVSIAHPTALAITDVINITSSTLTATTAAEQLAELPTSATSDIITITILIPYANQGPAYAQGDTIQFNIIKRETEEFIFDPFGPTFTFRGFKDIDGVLGDLDLGNDLNITFAEQSWEVSPNVIFSIYDFDEGIETAKNEPVQGNVIFDLATRQPRLLASNTTGAELSVSGFETTQNNILIVATGPGLQDTWAPYNVSNVAALIEARVAAGATVTAEVVSPIAQPYQSNVDLEVSNGVELSLELVPGAYRDDTETFTPNLYDTDDQELAIGVAGTSAGVPTFGQMNRLLMETIKNSYTYNAAVADLGRPKIFETGSTRDLIFSEGALNPISVNPAYVTFVSTERSAQTLGYVGQAQRQAVPYEIGAATPYQAGSIVAFNNVLYKGLIPNFEAGSKLVMQSKAAPTTITDPVTGLTIAQRIENVWDPVSLTKTRTENLYLSTIVGGLQTANEEEAIPSNPITDDGISNISLRHLTTVRYPVIILPLAEFDLPTTSAEMNQVLLDYGVARSSEITSGIELSQQILAEIDIKDEDTVLGDDTDNPNEITVRLADSPVDPITGTAYRTDGSQIVFRMPSREDDIITGTFQYFNIQTGQAVNPIIIPARDFARSTTNAVVRTPGEVISQPELDFNALVTYTGSEILASNNTAAAGAVWTFQRHRPIAAISLNTESHTTDLIEQITKDTVETETIILDTTDANTNVIPNTNDLSFRIKQLTTLDSVDSSRLQVSDILFVPRNYYTLNAVDNTINFEEEVTFNSTPVATDTNEIAEGSRAGINLTLNGVNNVPTEGAAFDISFLDYHPDGIIEEDSTITVKRTDNTVTPPVVFADLTAQLIPTASGLSYSTVVIPTDQLNIATAAGEPLANGQTISFEINTKLSTSTTTTDVDGNVTTVITGQIFERYGSTLTFSVFNDANLSRIIRSMDVEELERVGQNINTAATSINTSIDGLADNLITDLDGLERRIKGTIFPLY